MEVTYTLTPNDLVRFNNFLLRRSPVLLFRLILACLFVPVVALAVAALMPGGIQLTPVTLLATLLLTALWTLLLFSSTKRAVIKRNKDTPGVLGLRTVRIGPGGVQAQTSVADTTLKWASFTEITDDPTYVFLLMSRTYGVIVPKQAFGTAEASGAFLEAARLYWASPGQTIPTSAEPSGIWPPPPQTLKS